MLKQRVITALILVAILIAAIFFLPFHFFAAIASAFFIVAIWEWGQFPRFTSLPHIIYTVATVILSGLVYLWCSSQQAFLQETNLLLDASKVAWVVGLASMWWLVAFILVKAYPSATHVWNNRWSQSVIGCLVLIPTWLGIIFLHQQHNGAWLIVILVACVVCADTGAYFVGRAIGKNKLAPSVSPGKSKEGFYGGFACSVIFAVVLALSLGEGYTHPNWWIVAIVAPASLVSVLGDLLESMFKRERGIKDSGKILPGHGGILDRIDSISAAVPVFALVYILSGWQL